MSLSSLLKKSEECFIISQKIIHSLSEKYGFEFDDAWSHISSSTPIQLQKRFKKQRKANNPLSSIKKPRTSFSFYTKENRIKIQKKNPNATFGELSKLVSVDWKKITEKDKNYYKKLETKDKKRYEQEKEELLKSIAENKETVITDPTEEVNDSVAIKKEVITKPKPKSVPKKKTSSKTGNYNAFQKKQRPILKQNNSKMATRDQNAELGKMWQSLSNEEKAVYV
jgi:hypothetical protein